jgi:hypothetical protein
MRIILIAALFFLPLSAVAAKPLHNLVPDSTHHHHPVTGKKLHNTAKAGLDVHQMHKDANIHKMPHHRVHDMGLVFPQ